METVGYTIRLPRNLHAALKRVAQDQDRSLNAQIVRYLAQGVRSESPDVAAKQSPDSASDPTGRLVAAGPHGATQEA